MAKMRGSVLVVCILSFLLNFSFAVEDALTDPSLEIIKEADAEEGLPPPYEDPNSIPCRDPTPVNGALEVVSGIPFKINSIVVKLKCLHGLVFPDGTTEKTEQCFAAPTPIRVTGIWSPDQGRLVCQEPKNKTVDETETNQSIKSGKRFLETLLCMDPKSPTNKIKVLNGNPNHLYSTIQVSCPAGTRLPDGNNVVNVTCLPLPDPCYCKASWQTLDKYLLLSDFNCTAPTPIVLNDPTPSVPMHTPDSKPVPCFDPTPENGALEVISGIPFLIDSAKVKVMCLNGLQFPDGTTEKTAACLPAPTPYHMTGFWVPSFGPLRCEAPKNKTVDGTAPTPIVVNDHTLSVPMHTPDSKPVPCFDPTPENGALEVVSGIPFLISSAKVKVMCLNGLQFPDGTTEKTAMCLPASTPYHVTGVWTPPFGPLRCEEKPNRTTIQKRFLDSLVCIDPKTPDNTVTELEGDPFHMGSKIQVRCNEGSHFKNGQESVNATCTPLPHPCMCMAAWTTTVTFDLMYDFNCTVPAIKTEPVQPVEISPGTGETANLGETNLIVEEVPSNEIKRIPETSYTESSATAKENSEDNDLTENEITNVVNVGDLVKSNEENEQKETINREPSTSEINEEEPNEIEKSSQNEEVENAVVENEELNDEETNNKGSEEISGQEEKEEHVLGEPIEDVKDDIDREEKLQPEEITVQPIPETILSELQMILSEKQREEKESEDGVIVEEAEHIKEGVEIAEEEQTETHAETEQPEEVAEEDEEEESRLSEAAEETGHESEETYESNEIPSEDNEKTLSEEKEEETESSDNNEHDEEENTEQQLDEEENIEEHQLDENEANEEQHVEENIVEEQEPEEEEEILGEEQEDGQHAEEEENTSEGEEENEEEEGKEEEADGEENVEEPKEEEWDATEGRTYGEPETKDEDSTIINFAEISPLKSPSIIYGALKESFKESEEDNFDEGNNNYDEIEEEEAYEQLQEVEEGHSEEDIEVEHEEEEEEIEENVQGEVEETNEAEEIEEDQQEPVTDEEEIRDNEEYETDSFLSELEDSNAVEPPGPLYEVQTTPFERIDEDIEQPIENADNPCSQPPRSGTGKLIHARYFYNSFKNECELFNYGGEEGNKNNFESLDECVITCVTSNS